MVWGLTPHETHSLVGCSSVMANYANYHVSIQLLAITQESSQFICLLGAAVFGCVRSDTKRWWLAAPYMRFALPQESF